MGCSHSPKFIYPVMCGDALAQMIHDSYAGTCPNFIINMPEKKTTIKKIQDVLDSLEELLIEKNRRYGDSALNPLNVFSNTNPEEGICLRLDDKLARVQNSSELRKNDIADIMGYLSLLCAAKGWDDFDDLID